jgi:transposase
MRHELNDREWAAIKPMLPNKPRGVPRVNDRRVLNGIFRVLRSGAPWRDLPDNFGPYTTCYNRFVRWGRAGVWAKIMSALASARDVAVQMIDTKLAANYLAFIQLASIRLWLRANESTSLDLMGLWRSTRASGRHLLRVGTGTLRKHDRLGPSPNLTAERTRRGHPRNDAHDPNRTLSSHGAAGKVN